MPDKPAATALSKAMPMPLGYLAQAMGNAQIPEGDEIMFKKMLTVGLLCALCFCAPVRCDDATTIVKDAEALKVQIAKMRGRLLYKKGQIRKLEKEACEKNVQLKEKTDELEKERRIQFIAANPKLEGLYTEQDALEAEIQKMNSEKSTLKKR